MSKIILGIDEVGRGPWAGPLVIGAVILGEDFKSNAAWDELTDSKAITAKKRLRLAPIIEQSAIASATGWVSATELDHYGLGASLKLATRRAVKQILLTKAYFDEIIIDGTSNFLDGTPLQERVTVLKKADQLIKEVSAASIIAKVARDNYMIELSQKYPGYGFEQHMGYGTKQHQAALQTLGICPEHRQSFRPVQPFSPQKEININPNTSTAIGRRAEQQVAKYLNANGHHIIAQNYRTAAYEIDLISHQQGKIYFTEVKYSQHQTTERSALMRITPTKQKQMRFAAEAFLAKHPEYQSLAPVLAVANVSGENFTVKDWFILD